MASIPRNSWGLPIHEEKPASKKTKYVPSFPGYLKPALVSVSTKEVTPPEPSVSATAPPKMAATLMPPKAAAAPAVKPLRADDLCYEYTMNPKRVPALSDPEIWNQKITTDHMVACRWTASHGWNTPQLKPYGPLQLDPTASCLHYSTECFEGMKAYRGFDGKLRLFRPRMNAERMKRSAERTGLPTFDPAELEKLIIKFMGTEAPKWLPKERKGSFLYIRPTLIGTTAAIGVQKPNEALLFIVAVILPVLDEAAAQPLPSGKLAPPKGMTLLASQPDTIRAWPGGFGNAKVGANYGPSLDAQGKARAAGYDQILWLLGDGLSGNASDPDESAVTEAGASNLFVVWKTKDGKIEIVTASLEDGVVLAGVTRASVLALLRERLSIDRAEKTTFPGAEGVEDVSIIERRFTMKEIIEARKEGRLIEAFASGTAVSYTSPS